jgi:FixJ family two-component response regulator
MPGRNGLELQEVLRSQGYRIPIILITAFPNERHRSRALEGGALGFLSKPFDEVSFLQCLTAAFAIGGKADVTRTPPEIRCGLICDMGRTI